MKMHIRSVNSDSIFVKMHIQFEYNLNFSFSVFLLLFFFWLCLSPDSLSFCMKRKPMMILNISDENEKQISREMSLFV